MSRVWLTGGEVVAVARKVRKVRPVVDTVSHVDAVPESVERLGACPDGVTRRQWRAMGAGSFARRALPTLDAIERDWR